MILVFSNLEDEIICFNDFHGLLNYQTVFTNISHWKVETSIFDLNLRWFCLYFAYGPYQYSGLGYPSVFIRSFDYLNSNNNPIIINDGLQKFDYIYIDDVCDALYRFCHFDLIESYNVINIGSGKAYNIKDVVYLITRNWNRRFNTDFSPVYFGEDFTKGTYRSCNNDKLRTLFNWEPNTDLEEGIDKMLDWYI